MKRKGKRVEWVWEPRGAAVIVDSFRYERSDFTFDELNEFVVRLSRVREILSHLSTASMFFRNGRADYLNAAENYTNLLEEIGKLELEMVRRAKDLGAFFTPTGIYERFDRDPESYARFMDECIDVLMRTSKNAGADQRNAGSRPVEPESKPQDDGAALDEKRTTDGACVVEGASSGAGSQEVGSVHQPA